MMSTQNGLERCAQPDTLVLYPFRELCRDKAKAGSRPPRNFSENALSK